MYPTRTFPLWLAVFAACTKDTPTGSTTETGAPTVTDTVTTTDTTVPAPSAEPIEDEDLWGTEPRVAVDPAGNAFVVWTHFDGQRINTWANRYDAANGAWGTAQIIDGADADTFQPSVATNADGDAFVAWRQGGGQSFVVSIVAAAYDASSGTWLPPIEIDDNGGEATRPRVAVAPDGDAVVVWSEKVGSIWGLYLNRWDAATGYWSGTTRLGADHLPVFDLDNPEIAIDSNGDIYVVGQSGPLQIFNVPYHAETGLWTGGPQIINFSQYMPPVGGPRIAMSPTTGQAVVGYVEVPFGSSWRLVTALHTLQGLVLEWDLGKSALFPAYASDDEPLGLFDVGITDAGDVLTVFNAGSDTVNAYWNLQPADGFFGEPVLLETSDEYAGWPVLTMLPDGGAVAVWPQGDGVLHLFAARYTPGEGFSEPVRIDTADGNVEYGQQVASNAAGQVVATWPQSDGPRIDIWAAVVP